MQKHKCPNCNKILKGTPHYCPYCGVLLPTQKVFFPPFTKLWHKIKNDLKKHPKIFKTLVREAQFTARYDTATGNIIVTPQSTGIPRRISKSEFYRVWNLHQQTKDNHYKVSKYSKESYNATYILTLIQYYSK